MKLKKVIKELLLTIDSLLCPIVVPIVVRIKGVNLLHLSFDDVPFIMSEGGGTYSRVLCSLSAKFVERRYLYESLFMEYYANATGEIRFNSFILSDKNRFS